MSSDSGVGAPLNFSRIQLARALKEDPDDENALPLDRSAIFSRLRMKQNGSADIEVPSNFHVPRPLALVVPTPLTSSDHNSQQTPVRKAPSAPRRPTPINTSFRNSQVISSDMNEPVNSRPLLPPPQHATLLDVRKSMLEERSVRNSLFLHQRSSNDSLRDTHTPKHPRGASKLSVSMIDANQSSTRYLPPRERAGIRPSSVYTNGNTQPPTTVRPPSHYSSSQSLPLHGTSRPLSTVKHHQPADSSEDEDESSSSQPLPRHGTSRPLSTAKYHQPVDSSEDEDEDEEEKEEETEEQENESSESSDKRVKSHVSKQIRNNAPKDSSSDDDDDEEEEEHKGNQKSSTHSPKLSKVVEEHSEESSEETEEDEDEDNEDDDSDDDTPLALKTAPRIVYPTKSQGKDGIVEEWLTGVSRPGPPPSPKGESRGHRLRPSQPEYGSRRLSFSPEQAHNRRPRSALIHDELVPPSPQYAVNSRRRSNSDFSRPSRPQSFVGSPMLGPIVHNPKRDSMSWAKNTLIALSEDYRSASYPNLRTPPPKGPGEFYMNGSGNRSRSGSNSSLNKALLKSQLWEGSNGDLTKHRRGSGGGDILKEHYRDGSGHRKKGHRSDSSREARKGHHRDTSSGSSGGSHRSYPSSPYIQGTISRDSLHSSFSSSASSLPSPIRQTPSPSPIRQSLTPVSSSHRTSSENVMPSRGSIYVQSSSKNRVR